MNMNNFLEFAKKPPILEGSICVNGKQKEGIFKPKWNKWSNTLCYQYYTFNDRMGSGGFTLMKAYKLLELNVLTIKK